MASSSSTSQRNPPQEMLPLIPCPFCQDKLLTFVCGPSGSKPGERFYKCVWKDSGKCRFYEWQDGYARYLTAATSARPPAASAVDQHVAAIIAMVKDLLRLNLFVAATNLMATALLLAIFIAICAIVMTSRADSE